MIGSRQGNFFFYFKTSFSGNRGPWSRSAALNLMIPTPPRQTRGWRKNNPQGRVGGTRSQTRGGLSTDSHRLIVGQSSGRHRLIVGQPSVYCRPIVGQSAPKPAVRVGWTVEGCEGDGPGWTVEGGEGDGPGTYCKDYFFKLWHRVWCRSMALTLDYRHHTRYVRQHLNLTALWTIWLLIVHITARSWRLV